ncbi:hypothetical protein [Pseudodesulfovibrio tunisiensis]|uniref:hypothetical protein n=1 Tax=Pseudodesulfovibrio tunisiensis TaxID=463192 RepID=UPI001FB1AD14|nr:hypothetical protein [Pseudodesulfovibrio tunisiensis]
MMNLSLGMQVSRPIRMLAGAGLVLALVLIVYLPVSGKQDEYRAMVSRVRSQYLEAVSLAQRYAVLKKGKDGKQSVVLQEPLFSYVEKVTRTLKLNNRIDYVRPENRTRDDGSTVEVVHVAFKGISLNEFVRFLYHIEVEKREIYVRAISIKKDGRKNLDTQMTLQKFG